MRRELDFEREHRNLIQFRALFDRNRFLRIPEPISELWSRRVLTMGRLRGYKIDELHVSNFSCDERNEIARQYVNGDIDRARAVELSQVYGPTSIVRETPVKNTMNFVPTLGKRPMLRMPAIAMRPPPRMRTGRENRCS